jgi:hypothetical protein
MCIPSLALTVAAAFTGAAIYVSLVEQPARLGLDDRALLAQWRPSYKRGSVMQAGLALVGSVLGFAAWWQSGHWPWLTGAIALIAAWPYTLIVIRPTNEALLATPLEAAGPVSRAGIEKWGRLHLGRVAMGAVGTVCYFCGSGGF